MPASFALASLYDPRSPRTNETIRASDSEERTPEGTPDFVSISPNGELKNGVLNVYGDGKVGIGTTQPEKKKKKKKREREENTRTWRRKWKDEMKTES